VEGARHSQRITPLRRRCASTPPPLRRGGTCPSLPLPGTSAPFVPVPKTARIMASSSPVKGRAHEASCCVGRGAAFRCLPRKQAPEGPQPGRRFSKPVPSAPWGVVNGCVGRRRAGLTRLSGHRSPQGAGLDLAGTCPGGGTPLVAARETAGAEQRRSRMVDGAATRRPPAHVPRCRGAGTQIAGRVLAERPYSDYRLAFVERPPPLRLRAEDYSEGQQNPGRPSPAGRRSCVLRTPYSTGMSGRECWVKSSDGAEALPAELTLGTEPEREGVCGTEG
jgi:hypothetical protein